MAKLMKPLFYDGMFNREGKRIRAEYVRTVGEYPLWINAGSPDKDYTRNEQDKYYLYIQHGEWLVMTGQTEYELELRAGQEKVNKEWYGDFEGRTKYFDDNFYKGRPQTEAWELIKEHNKKEEIAMQEFGKDESVQFEFLKEGISQSIAKYIDARDNNGSFPDFIGALYLDELDRCVELSKIRKQRLEEERKQRREKAEQERKEKEERQKQEELKAVMEAEDAFQKGGVIRGGESIVALADKYNINIPIRTRGWILNNLSEVTITESGSMSYRYWKRSKNAKGSQKVWDVFYGIQQAMKEGA